MITLPGVAVSIILFLARRASLGNHSLFLFQRGNVEGTALGEKKISLLSFDLFACLENEEKKRKKREISKPSTLESFANHIVHRQKKTTHGTVRLLRPQLQHTGI